MGHADSLVVSEEKRANNFVTVHCKYFEIKVYNDLQRNFIIVLIMNLRIGHLL